MFCHYLKSIQILVFRDDWKPNKNFRVVCSFIRNANIIKTFIEKLIPKGNHIIYDGWSSYSFLNDQYSGYTHSIHIHGKHDFGFGLDSTSNIKGIWRILKNELKRVYANIHAKNFLLFLKEAEFKVKNKHLNNNQKIEIEFYNSLKES